MHAIHEQIKIKSLETCMYVASLHHQFASIRLQSMLMTEANCLAEIQLLGLAMLHYNPPIKFHIILLATLRHMF